MGLIPMAMIVPRSRGCVEKQASASLGMLSTQSTNVTHNMSQKEQKIQESKIKFDPILSKLQAKEQDGHAQMAISHQSKQMARKAYNDRKLSSSKDWAKLIDLNAVHLAKKVRAINTINVRKRKRKAYHMRPRKRQRLYTKSTRYFLLCFVLGHPWMVVCHIHKSGWGINRTCK